MVYPDGAVLREAAGHASLEAGRRMSPNHHLYVGSVTRVYTAMLVMEQVDRGAIALDEALDARVELPYGDRVTVRMLLDHTSGIPAHTGDAGFLARYFGALATRWQAEELLHVIEAKPLRFEPGSRHEYSNSNYLLLGVILERATGKPYGALLREAMGRLGLRHTYYLDYPPQIRIANAYDQSLLRLGRRNLTGFCRSLESGAYSAGGVLATSRDVALFLHALFSGRALSEPALAQMMTFVEAPDDDVPLQDGYGLGLTRLRVGRQAWVGHTGSIPGYSGIAVHNEATGHTVVTLSNRSVIDQAHVLAEVGNLLSPTDPPD